MDTVRSPRPPDAGTHAAPPPAAPPLDDRLGIRDGLGFARLDDHRLERFRGAFLAAGDLAAVAFSVGLGWVLSSAMRTSFHLPAFVQASVWQTFLAVLCFPAAIQLALSYRWGHYGRFKSFWTEVNELTKMTVYSAALGSIALFLLRMHYSRLWILLSLACLLVVNPLMRLAVKRALAKAGIWFRPLVVVGTSERALANGEALGADLAMGYQVVAFVRLPTAAGRSTSDETPLHGFLGSFEAGQLVGEVTAHHRTPHVLYALDSLEDFLYYRPLLDRLTIESENIIISPPVTGIPLSGIEVVGVARHETVVLRLENKLNKRTSRVIKRAFDCVAASLLLVASSPLLLFLYVRLAREGGSPIFAHERIGRDGRPFGCLKFRTMVTDADVVLEKLLASDENARGEWLRDFKLRDDPRITPLGRFLRKSNLDELPQLFNVLKGEMSLVGPRPIVLAEVDRYGDKFAHYRATRPGMTGIWQTSGRNDLSYAERVELDVLYVRNWSLWQDVVMLLRTFPLFVRTRGAY